jgi:hypothetical protein
MGGKEKRCGEGSGSYVGSLTKGKVNIAQDSASSKWLGVEEAVYKGGMVDRIIMTEGDGEGIKRKTIS